MRIVHGENEVKSREYLAQLRSEAKKLGMEIRSVNGEKIELINLEQELGEGDLFGSKVMVIIESLSKRKKPDVEEWLIRKQPKDVVIWEAKKVDARRLKKWGGEAKEFVVEKEMFSFLEGLAPGGQKRMLEGWERIRKTQAAELVFFMIWRQVKQMLLAIDGDSSLPGWLLRKLQGQARVFGKEGLVRAVGQLYEMEKRVKSGAGKFSLDEELETWLLTL